MQTKHILSSEEFINVQNTVIDREDDNFIWYEVTSVFDYIFFAVCKTWLTTRPYNRNLRLLKKGFSLS